MKPSIFLPLLLDTVFAGTVGVDIFRARRQHGSGHTSRGDAIIYDRFINSAGAHAQYVPDSLSNGFYAYYANLTLGSNDQHAMPQIDTGSSDLWLDSSTNPYCARTPSEVNDEEGQFNCTGYLFDPYTSTSYRNLSEPYDISYLDTTGAFGWLSQDTLKIGGATIPNATFALADVANSSTAVFGIGYKADEATVYLRKNGTFGGEYPNLPVLLKRDGYIDSIAYSLYLNDIEAQTGEILFGGVNHAQYDGTLGLMPIVNLYYPKVNETSEFTVKWSGLSLRTGDNVCPLADFVIPALLDSGTSYAILPKDIVNAMGEAMGYTFPTLPNATYWQGSCSPSFDFDSFELDFLGKKLEVPPQSLLDYLQDEDGADVYDSEGNHVCVLAIDQGEDPSDFILGDVFMRNWYIVYDLDNNQVAMAQSKFNVTDEDIEPIVSSIPAATSVKNYNLGGYRMVVSTHSVASACTAKPTSSSRTVFSSASVVPSSSAISTSKIVPTSHSASSPTKAASNNTIASSGSAHSSIPSTSSSNRASPSIVTQVVSSFVTTCPTPTTFSTNGAVYTVTNSTVLTITDCPCTLTHSATASPSPKTSPVFKNAESHTTAATTETTVVSSFVTTCPSPTTFVTNGKTYTVTDSTVLTITDCPCTLTHSANTATASPTSKTSPVFKNAESYTTAATTETTVVSSFVTTCPSPTTFVTNGKTYTVTDSTVLTITDCPCTLSKEGPKSIEAANGSSTASLSSSGLVSSSLVSPGESRAAKPTSTTGSPAGSTSASATPPPQVAGPSSFAGSAAPVLANSGSVLTASFSMILGSFLLFLV